MLAVMHAMHDTEYHVIQVSITPIRVVVFLALALSPYRVVAKAVEVDIFLQSQCVCVRISKYGASFVLFGVYIFALPSHNTREAIYIQSYSLIRHMLCALIESTNLYTHI